VFSGKYSKNWKSGSLETKIFLALYLVFTIVVFLSCAFSCLQAHSGTFSMMQKAWLTVEHRAKTDQLKNLRLSSGQK